MSLCRIGDEHGGARKIREQPGPAPDGCWAGKFRGRSGRWRRARRPWLPPGPGGGDARFIVGAAFPEGEQQRGEFAGDEGSGPNSWYSQDGAAAHASPQLCHAFARKRDRYPHLARLAEGASSTTFSARNEKSTSSALNKSAGQAKDFALAGVYLYKEHNPNQPAYEKIHPFRRQHARAQSCAGLRPVFINRYLF